MSLRFVLCLVFLAASAACAQDPNTVEVPKLSVGDYWLFRRVNQWKNEEIGLMRVSIKTVVTDFIDADVKFTPSSSPEQAIEGLHRRGSTDVVIRCNFCRFSDPKPLQFPLFLEKEWQNEFSVDRKTSITQIPYKAKAERWSRVEGWETVTVPAGTFRALRISQKTRAFFQDNDGVFPAYDYQTIWYVPEVKWFVKWDARYMTTAGTLNSQTMEELVEFRLQ